MSPWKLAILALCSSAIASAAQAQAGFTRLPVPPPGFEPLTASNADLLRYGLPARPPLVGRAGGLPYAVWARAMASARHRIEPEIRATGRRHGPMRRVSRAVSAGTEYTYNWAGELLLNGNTTLTGSSFAEVIGQWVVPTALQPPGSCAGTDYSSLWVGVDGDVSTDVMQAGTEQDASCSNGVTTPDYYAWFEWYPDDEYEITNFPVPTGISIFVVVQATSPTTAQASFVNLQSNQYTAVSFNAPAGTRLVGNSAEWVIERPEVNNTLTSLSNFGMTMVSAELAYTASQIGGAAFETPYEYGPGVNGLLDVMLNSAQTTIVLPFPQGISADVLESEGPVR